MVQCDLGLDCPIKRLILSWTLITFKYRMGVFTFNKHCSGRESRYLEQTEQLEVQLKLCLGIKNWRSWANAWRLVGLGQFRLDCTGLQIMMTGARNLLTECISNTYFTNLVPDLPAEYWRLQGLLPRRPNQGWLDTDGWVEEVVWDSVGGVAFFTKLKSNQKCRKRA